MSCAIDWKRETRNCTTWHGIGFLGGGGGVQSTVRSKANEKGYGLIRRAYYKGAVTGRRLLTFFGGNMYKGNNT